MLDNFSNEKLDIASKHYHKIQQPLLVIYGNCDSTTPSFGGVRLSGECKQTELHILDKTGHLILEERPKTLQKLIGEFLRKNQF